jgi:hypothetical protein
MTTYHLHLVNDIPENTAVTVRWKCTSCGHFADFAREGLGTPWASETVYPDDGDVYYGNGMCIPALIYIPKEVFYGYFTDVEIVSINDSQHDTAKATRFRYQQLTTGIPINHPLVINTMHELEALGLLGINRADEILAACNPI